MIVLKDFNTVTQRFKAGVQVVVTDVEIFEHWITRKFLGDDTPPAVVDDVKPPSLPPSKTF